MAKSYECKSCHCYSFDTLKEFVLNISDIMSSQSNVSDATVSFDIEEGELYVNWYRDSTEEEIKEMKNKETILKENRRQQYLALKKEFEPNL